MKYCFSILAICLFSSFQALAQCLHPDFDALMQLYSSTNGAAWTHQSGWAEGAAGTNCAPCSWYGVTCDGTNRVTAIKLDTNNLSGALPDMQFPKLSTFSAWKNNITGPIPDFTGLPVITEIKLQANQLSGAIPDFSAIPTLKNLYLADNQLDGSVPDFSNLQVLSIFVAARNQLTGSVPAFDNMPQIGGIDLSENQLSGTIPDLSGLFNLSVLSLFGNQLSGNLPNPMPDALVVDFGNNQLTGPIPDLSNLFFCSFMNLSGNHLTGPVPDFSQLPFISDVNVSRNSLSGNVPVMNAPGVHVALENNNLTFSNLIAAVNQSTSTISYGAQNAFFHDTIFHAVKNQPFTIDLEIDNSVPNNLYSWTKDSMPWTPPAGNAPNSNQLIFTAPQTADAGRYFATVTNPDAPALTLYSYPINFQVCDVLSDSLQLVALYNATGGPAWANRDNWLEAGQPIDTWHGITTGVNGCVEKILLPANNLNGALPALDLNTLKELDLSDNSLAAQIPEMHTPFLVSLNLSGNGLVGPFPDAMKMWMDLQSLDISSNNVTGPIPPDLGDLCELTELRLNNNNIGGELPEELTKLFNLQIGKVDFSNNQIDSLKQKIIFFCPFGDNILAINPSYDRFLGICNVQCTGAEWDNPADFPWIADTVAALTCNPSGCESSTVQAGFVTVRGVQTVFTRQVCYTQLGPPPVYTENVRFYDCGGHLLETASCDQNQFCTQFGAITRQEFENLTYDIRWFCGQEFSDVAAQEPVKPGQKPTEKMIFRPNPAHSTVSCTLQTPVSATSVRVYNVLGEWMPVPTSISGNRLQLEVSRLPKGLYFIAAIGETGRISGQLVVE